ncbi:MAG: hypothetical protein H7222_12905 [Methylotenera sp.]|nr:hypothetical protein [Oligoflexia bacterium]
MLMLQTVSELKEKLFSLAALRAGTCASVMARRLATRDGLLELALALDSVGFAYCRQGFDWINAAEWERMEYALQISLGLRRPITGVQALADLCRDITSETIDWNADSSEVGPFDFLNTLDPREMRALFTDQPTAEIAMISVYRDAEAMGAIFDQLEPARRREVILQISRAEKLPREAVRNVAHSFAEKLRRRHADLCTLSTLPDSIASETEVMTEAIIEIAVTHDSELNLAMETLLHNESQLSDETFIRYFESEAPEIVGEIRKALSSPFPATQAHEALWALGNGERNALDEEEYEYSSN